MYPARGEWGRWRAVWHENGVWRLRGADLIAFYLSADRLPARRQ